MEYVEPREFYECHEFYVGLSSVSLGTTFVVWPLWSALQGNLGLWMVSTTLVGLTLVSVGTVGVTLAAFNHAESNDWNGVVASALEKLC